MTESFRDSISGGTIYLIADTVACNDISTAIAEGYTVEALPLADVTGVGDAVGFLNVEWADIKKGSCLAILKEAEAVATTLAPEEETSIETAEEETTDVPRRRKKRMFSSSVLRTEGLPRVFTAINLATFSVLSVGVTGAQGWLQSQFYSDLESMPELRFQVLLLLLQLFLKLPLPLLPPPQPVETQSPCGAPMSS